MAENGVQKELTSAQRKGLASLLASRNVRDAAVASGISERTFSRWLAEPCFVAALSAAEGQAIDHGTRRLVAMVDKALDELESELDDVTAPQALRQRAAVAVLEQVVKLRELRNVESRLAALEASVYANG